MKRRYSPYIFLNKQMGPVVFDKHFNVECYFLKVSRPEKIGYCPFGYFFTSVLVNYFGDLGQRTDGWKNVEYQNLQITKPPGT
jgi:hypothetical protein